MNAATLRCQYDEGTSWVPALDVAALLLDAAATADDHPDLTASVVLRGLAAGLANYRREPE